MQHKRTPLQEIGQNVDMAEQEGTFIVYLFIQAFHWAMSQRLKVNNITCESQTVKRSWQYAQEQFYLAIQP